MLEIKNVSKTYRPKKGVPVKALDDVSLKFEDRGMVFILGKSGSGKSTLLNVLGGLDTADSGEFIIKDKSSNDFTQSDFDSYRNTFIGFIFQEYNILSEFTVGQNIALAMELQGKKATSEELNAILTEVDLEDYGNRKPNELSGGQKQRVAIARALIKKPEIIMADEPTGALDSRTGKQVFDTLKKLSKEKLVLIVSHDREFAEQYADRIIELKDGKILSDVSKTSLAPTEVSGGVSVVDGGFIRVKKGYKLTKKDLDLIAEYIEKADTDALISIDGKKSEEVKKVAGINDEGGKDVFSDTDESNVKLKSYTPADSKLIRSKLPFKNSLKMGASSLKTKPVRLVFTIFLCFVAFTLFGLADTMASYNKTQAFVSSIADSQITTAAFTKQSERDSSGGYVSTTDFNLTDADLADIKEKTGVNVLPVYSGPDRWSSGFSFSALIAETDNLESPNGNALYNTKISGYAEITPEFLDENGVQLVSGKLPESDYEIAIPKFIYDQIKLGGIATYDPTAAKSVIVSAESVTDYDSVVGKYIQTSNLGFPYIEVTEGKGNESWTTTKTPEIKIVGVYDTKLDTTKYADFMPGAEQKNGSMMDSLITMQMSADRDYGLHAVVAVNKGMIEKMKAYANRQSGNQSSEVGVNVSGSGDELIIENDYSGYSVDRIVKLSQMSEVGEVVWLDGTPKTTLAQNEILVPYVYDHEKGERNLDDSFISSLESALGKTLTDAQKTTIEESTYSDIYHGSIHSAIRAIVSDAPTDYIKSWMVNSFGWPEDGPYNNPNDPEHPFVTFDEVLQSSLYTERKSEILSSYVSALMNEYYDENLYAGEKSGKEYETILRRLVLLSMNETRYPSSGVLRADTVSGSVSTDYTVVGKFIPLSNTDSMVCVADEIYNKFGSVENGIYSFAIGKLDYTDRAALEKIVKYSLTRNAQSCTYPLENSATAILDYVGSLVETLSQVFLYVGIGFAVFSALMMFNFISVSINQKKREIGILRAVGARSSDVFGIFLNESMIITLINFVLSAVATAVVCGVLNGVFRGYGLPITLLSFGIRQIGLLLGLGVLVAFIGSFFPVMRIAKKRPIDAIQNR